MVVDGVEQSRGDTICESGRGSADAIMAAAECVESLGLFEAGRGGEDVSWLATPFGRDAALSVYWVGMQGYFLHEDARLSEEDVLRWGA